MLIGMSIPHPYSLHHPMWVKNMKWDFFFPRGSTNHLMQSHTSPSVHLPILTMYSPLGLTIHSKQVVWNYVCCLPLLIYCPEGLHLITSDLQNRYGNTHYLCNLVRRLYCLIWFSGEDSAYSNSEDPGRFIKEALHSVWKNRCICFIFFWFALLFS